jgi:hypothetical protein
MKRIIAPRRRIAAGAASPAASARARERQRRRPAAPRGVAAITLDVFPRAAGGRRRVPARLGQGAGKPRCSAGDCGMKEKLRVKQFNRSGRGGSWAPQAGPAAGARRGRQRPASCTSRPPAAAPGAPAGAAPRTHRLVRAAAGAGLTAQPARGGRARGAGQPRAPRDYAQPVICCPPAAGAARPPAVPTARRPR